MNPDQNRSGMTVNALMALELVASTFIPVVFFGVLGILALQLDRTNLLIAITAFAIIVLIVVTLVNYIVQRKIREWVTSLIDVCRDYAGGERSVRAVVNGDDDFAVLANSLNMLLDNQSPGASNISLGASGSEAAALQAQIEKLLQEVSAVGDGDLRVQAEVTPDTLGVLADSFNYMIEELAKVVGRVQSTAVQVTNATRRILDRSAELAQASEAQVKQIAQTTEAVEALAVFIQNVARNAQLSVEAAQDALHNAANGQQAVRQTIEGMVVIRENVQETSKKIKRLGERSNEIGEIVRIIEDIADQTNLLALNAAIQSAMAGEHGRGFAVVAEEIRLLAERSTDSTKRIATLVKSIQGDTYEAVVAMEDSTQEVVKGSQLADDAGRSLNLIYSAVERQTQMIENIARAANDQTSVSEAVAVAMSRISEITRQTDAGAQEAAVSVSYLAELSEQLRASVSTFRLPDRTNDMLGTFSNMTSVTEVSDPRNNPFASSMGSDVDHNWNQGFPGNFPPLPEPGNTGSLVPLASRSGQYTFNNQQESGRTAGFSMSQMGGNAPYQNTPQTAFTGSQPGAGGGAGFGNQQYFGNQQDFGDMNGFENQQGFPNGFGNAPFGSVPAFNEQSQQYNGQGQQFSGQGQQYNGQSQQFSGQGQQYNGQGQQYFPSAYPNQSGQPGQNPNSGLLPTSLPPAGQPSPARQRWQPAPQKEQNQ